MMPFKIVLTFCLSILNLYAISQKKFDAILTFPAQIDLEKLSLQIDNGFGRREESFKITGDNQIRISGYYYSRYAAIILHYPQSENLVFKGFFFLNSRPARIKFLASAKDFSPFQQYVMTNAFDFKSERDKLLAFTEGEAAKANEFYKKHGSLIFDGQHKDLTEEFFKLDRNIYLKTIEYIKTRNRSYYSFWYFRSNILASGLPADSILSIYEKIFPLSLKETEEGKAYKQLLIGKMVTKKGNEATGFTSKDINGKTLTLSEFRNKKLVLLNFWATWCGPCIKKMPLLADLMEKYGQSLEIISVAYPTTLSETKQLIAEKNMNWVNIYDDAKLINSYGGMGAGIPRVFLIDKSGKIIYDNHETQDGDGEMETLKQLLQQELVKKN